MFYFEKMMNQRPGRRGYVEIDEAGAPKLWDHETIDYELSNCEISFDATVGAIGNGKLYITSKRLIWLGESIDNAYDYDIPYIGLHAVSRDEASYPKPCVYCQFDVEEEEIDEEDDETQTEMFLVPEKEEDVMKLFDALSHAAMLNPDPEEDGDELDGDFIYDLSEVQLGAEQARKLDHLESVFKLPGDDNGDYDEDGGEMGEGGEVDEEEEQQYEEEQGSEEVTNE